MNLSPLTYVKAVAETDLSLLQLVLPDHMASILPHLRLQRPSRSNEHHVVLYMTTRCSWKAPFCLLPSIQPLEARPARKEPC
jgi:hypothetical protein